MFSVANLAGDTGDSPGPTFRVNPLDLAAVKRALGIMLPDEIRRFDFNRDGRVNALDLAAARQNLGRRLGEPPGGGAGVGVQSGMSIRMRDGSDTVGVESLFR